MLGWYAVATGDDKREITPDSPEFKNKYNSIHGRHGN